MASTTESEELHGMRVLVVEDSYLIAYSVRRILVELGCTVIGPVSTVAEARRLIETDQCDAAILDINLGAESSVPLAEMLNRRHTPFFFVTGYSSPALPLLEFQAYRRLRKPLTAVSLRTAMLEDFVRKP
jgi:CheY-like chemotaxis protein